MALNIENEVASMRRMTVGDLQKKFAEVFGEQPRGRNKQWLVKRIAWRMQANVEGGLSERARRRALEIANDADLRLSASKTKVAPIQADVTSKDERLPSPGTILTRRYKGRTFQVTVLRDGFVFEGEKFRSLTAVAKAITGSHWNGFLFFGLRNKETAQ